MTGRACLSRSQAPPPASGSVARGWGLRTGLTGSQVVLLLLIPGLHSEKRRPKPQSLLSSSDKLPHRHCCWSAPMPFSSSGVVLVCSVPGSPPPRSKSQGSHHSLSGSLSMDPSLTCDKGSFNLPLGVQVGGRKAVKPAALLQHEGSWSAH